MIINRIVPLFCLIGHINTERGVNMTNYSPVSRYLFNDITSF